jgi:zinc transport system permease protein
LGCFIVWRRMAYFGDTLAHSALLGVTVGLLLQIDLTAAVASGCVLIALLIVLLQQQTRLATDTVLGILAHSSLALGLVTLSLVQTIRIDLLGYLFGDVLAVSWGDILFIYVGGGAVLLALIAAWRWLLFATIHEELARAEGARVLGLRFLLMILVAIVIAAAMKIVGILLITSLLIIPAAAARQMSRTPEQMALLAALFGAASVTGGLAASYRLDGPAGASIVVVALLLFIAAQIARLALDRTARAALPR